MARGMDNLTTRLLSTLDSLFPSIYQTSIHNDAKLLQEETNGVTKPQDHALQLPKTFVTRKGAMLLFAQNGTHTMLDQEKQHRNNEKIKVDASVIVEEQMPPAEKRKMFLEFLDVFLKDETRNQHANSVPVKLKENNWTIASKQPEEETENVFKVLSRPKSINSLYSYENQVKRQKARPNTAIPGNVIPKEPEQPKAHPRITSGKPRLPTRALGKLSSKSACSEFDKEKTSSQFLQPPSTGNHQTYSARQLTTPNYSTTNETVQDDRVSIPRPNSECPFERSERVSRAASSISRYSTWWAMDDVSLSYYDNAHQDDDGEHQECVECLSEQRSEIGRTVESDHDSDIETETGSTKRAMSIRGIPKSKDSDSVVQLSVHDDGFDVEKNNDERLPQHWPSARDSQEELVLQKGVKTPSSSYERDFGNATPGTFEDDWFEDSTEEKPSKYRVKSAPCSTKRNRPMFRRKALSAGLRRPHTPTMLCREQEAASENFFIRIPSAASYYDDENDQDTKDDLEKASFSEYTTKCGMLEENRNTESSNVRLASVVATSSEDVAYSGYKVEPIDDAIDGDTFESPTQIADHDGSEISGNVSLPTSVKQDSSALKEDVKFTERQIKGAPQDILADKQDTKPAKQDTKPAKQYTKPAKQDTKPAKQDTKPAKQDAKPAKQDTKPAKQDTKPAKQDTKPAKQDTKLAKQDAKPVKQDIKPAKQDVKPAKQDTKIATQDSCLGSDVIALQSSEISITTSNSEGYLTLGNKVDQTQASSQNISTTSDLPESQNTELSNGSQRETNESIPSIVLSLEGNPVNRKDDGENNTTTISGVKETNPAKERNFKEKLGFSDEDNDSVANFNDDIEANNQENMPCEIAELEQGDGVESEETASAGDRRKLTATTIKSPLSDLFDFKKVPENDLNTNDSEIKECTMQLLSETNFKSEKLSKESRIPNISKIQEFRLTETDNVQENLGAHISSIEPSSTGKSTTIRHTTNLALGLRDTSGPIKEQESGSNSLADTQKVNHEVSNARIFERNITNNEQEMSKLNKNSTIKSLKVKTEKTKREKLDVQGVGKADSNTNEGKEKVEIKMENKVDLSDLLAKKSSNKTVKKPVSGKKAKSPKTARKHTRVSDQTPEPEPRLDVIPVVDENLLKIIENPNGALELSEETLNQFAPVEDFQEQDVTSALEEKSIKTSDAFSPSKVKKGGKKGGRPGRKKGKIDDFKMTATRRDSGEERKKKMAEEKAKQDEEMELLKEREEEQRRLLEEAKEKQRTIEEEREKRLAQEIEAKRQEEEAEKALKEAKRKAKEEREKRREEEAERRRMEVQKKREEKRKRELEIQKQEEELEKQRVDREQKMAELRAQKERELELERIAEEERQEEERRRLLELEEEKRKEEKRIREAEEAVQQMAREREYREQMRKIAEAQQVKLEKQEMERRAREEAERAAIEEERKRLEHEAQMREHEEQERVRELRQQEAIARIRAAHEASKRRAWALRRRAQNTERMANLKFTRQAQKLTEAFTFSYHVHVSREVWELPYDWNSKKKRGSFRPAKKKGGKKT